MSSASILLPYCLCVIVSMGWLHALVRGRLTDRVSAAALVAQETTIRLLRLAATDQRNVALTLLGYAETSQLPDNTLTGLAQRLIAMSDNLNEQTETPASARVIEEEELLLMPAVEFARAQVTAHLGPSRRTWRVDKRFETTWLGADRRALNQILVNVLSGAAASTRDGDWIEVNCMMSPTEWVLVVQDEGIGLPVAQSDRHPEESRGIGLELTMASSLMKAHGGSLIVQSTEQVGTRVILSFPLWRLRNRLPGEGEAVGFSARGFAL